MKHKFNRLLALLGLALPVAAFAGPDYWAIEMSWAPQYCASNLSSKEPQCTEAHYFVLNGLQPKFLSGEGPGCLEDTELTRETVNAALWYFPNAPLLRQKWRRQGACSGLSQEQYFIELGRAGRRLLIPDAYLGVTEKLDTTSADLKQKFMAANSGLKETAIVPQCNGRWLRSVTVCVDTEFNFRACGLDVADKCRANIRLRRISPSRADIEPQ